MSSWRSILSWKTGPILPGIGSKVKVIADVRTLQKFIDTQTFDLEMLIEEVGEVNDIWDEATYGLGSPDCIEVKFPFYGTEYFPIENWERILKVVK
jgi:hypothetical protein